MKKILIALAIVVTISPALAFAGGKKHYDKPEIQARPAEVHPELKINPGDTITVTYDDTIRIPVTQTPPAGGNGMPWCTGPQSPGWNVSTGKCEKFSTTTNSITPETPTAPTYVKLSQLPNTGTDDVLFYVLIDFFIVLSIVLGYVFALRHHYVEKKKILSRV